eukprot:6191204-Pleurochrysis_carterae.AAC.1
MSRAGNQRAELLAERERAFGNGAGQSGASSRGQSRRLCQPLYQFFKLPPPPPPFSTCSEVTDITRVRAHALHLRLVQLAYLLDVPLSPRAPRCVVVEQESIVGLKRVLVWH